MNDNFSKNQDDIQKDSSNENNRQNSQPQKHLQNSNTVPDKTSKESASVYSDYIKESNPNYVPNISDMPQFEDSDKKSNKNTKIFFIIIAILLLLLIIGCSINIFIKSNKDNKNRLFPIDGIENFLENHSNDFDNLVDPNSPGMEINDTPASSQTLSAEQIYQKNSKSIVGVVIYDSSANVTSDPKGQGSGIVLTSDGYVVTNSHVVGDSKKYKVKVITSDSTEYSASVVGYDTRTDIAVVKVDANNLIPAEFGNSDQLNVGAWVLAIGNPGGIDFANSLTRGIISALNRTVSNGNLIKYIQTDAAINPGNSGGALLNMYGQVIGINTSKIVANGYEGMGFSIPINTAKDIINDLMSQGYVSGRVRLGMTGKVVSEYQAETYNVPQGIIVIDLSNDSALKDSGIEVGDIITKIENVDTTSFDILFTELSKYNPSDTVTLTVYRPKSDKSKASTFEVNVKLLEDKGETQN